jgi:hypothetical protein
MCEYGISLIQYHKLLFVQYGVRLGISPYKTHRSFICLNKKYLGITAVYNLD